MKRDMELVRNILLAITTKSTFLLCPACGHIAKAQFDEMYTSSKMIVDKLVSKIILKKQ